MRTTCPDCGGLEIDVTDTTIDGLSHDAELSWTCPGCDVHRTMAIDVPLAAALSVAGAGRRAKSSPSRTERRAGQSAAGPTSPPESRGRARPRG